jgi:hypothetical protein
MTNMLLQHLIKTNQIKLIIMKKLKIIAALLCLYGHIAMAQIPSNATQIDFGPTGGYFTNNALSYPCLQTGSVNSLSFEPACPSGPDITNSVTTTSFSAQGGAQINGQSTGSVIFQMVGTSVPNISENRYPTGRIYVDYTCSYDSTYTVSYCEEIL